MDDSISKYQEFIKTRCRNCQKVIPKETIFYKCPTCQDYLICADCQMYNFHLKHYPILKVKPEGWEPPLPFGLKVTETQKVERVNRFYPEQRSMLTPKQAAVYDQLLRLDGKRFNNKEAAERFEVLNKWFRNCCPKAWLALVD